MFEAIDAFFGDQPTHIRMNAVVPPCDRHMEAVIGGGFFRPAAPLLIGIHQGLLRVGDHEIDDHRGAACKTCSGAGIKIFRRHGAHEGKLHMGMGVNATRHHIVPDCIDDFRISGDVDIKADGFDLTIFRIYIGPPRLIRGDNGSALDQDRHGQTPLRKRDKIQ